MRNVCFTVLFLCFITNAGYAQQDTIPAENENDLKVISGFHLIGNKVTRERVILREMTLKKGDTLTVYAFNLAMQTSRNNLMNTSLFNFVTVDRLDLDSLHVLIYVSVTERWYTWPFPIFSLAETNFNTWWENKRFDRINYGIDITRYNFRGRNEKLKLKVQMGFTEQVALQYRVPFFNRNQTAGFNVEFSYSRNHEVNYGSLNNDRLFYKDSENYIRQNYGAGLSFYFRRKFFETSTIGINYNQVKVSDTVLLLNPNYLRNSGGSSEFLTLSYFYVHDRRNNKNYTLTGYYISAGVSKTGLGLLDSEVDLLDIHFGARKYWQLGKRVYFSGSLNAWQGINDNQPYILQGGLGYSDKSTIRSYELYVIDGQQMGIVKSQLRYELIAPKTFEIPFLPVTKFKKFHYSVYLGVFTDAGYVRDNDVIPENRLANEFQYGSGISLDWVTYYDLVWRTEYSINKYGEHGFFLHFVAPI